MGDITGDALIEVRDRVRPDEKRCELACLEYVPGRPYGDVISCEAIGTGKHADNPWDPANTTATISCTVRYIDMGGCT